MIQVWYHAECMDGFGAAWSAWRKFGDVATYVPVAYHEPMPKVERGDEVYIVDFSYSRDELLWLQAKVGKLVVLDHHKSAKENLEGLDFCVFDMQKSGAVMAWEYFHPGVEVPLFLRFIQDRDLWSWALEGSKPFNAGLYYCVQRDFRAWNELLTKAGRDRVVVHGMAALRVERKMVEDQTHPSRVRFAGWQGSKFAVVNAGSCVSEIGHALLERYPDVDAALVWHELADGQAKVSLRSRVNGLDVSRVAQCFQGGGGHRSAAGFTHHMSMVRWMFWL